RSRRRARRGRAARLGRPSAIVGTASALRGASFLREQPARTLLDEQDQKYEHEDLREDRADLGLEQLADDAEAEAADERAPEVSDAAEHDDHERVDDIGLPEI